MTDPFDVHEASIADLRGALVEGRVSAAGLLEAYLARISAYDGELNAVVAMNPDARRRRGIRCAARLGHDPRSP